MEQGLIKKLISSIKCGSCRHYYDEDNIDVIEHREEMWFLKVSCSFCHVKCLVAVILKEDDKLEVVSDLNMAELDKFKKVVGVSGDDVLDMHNFLKDFKSDFSHLFRQG